MWRVSSPPTHGWNFWRGARTGGLDTGKQGGAVIRGGGLGKKNKKKNSFGGKREGGGAGGFGGRPSEKKTPQLFGLWGPNKGAAGMTRSKKGGDLFSFGFFT